MRRLNVSLFVLVLLATLASRAPAFTFPITPYASGALATPVGSQSRYLLTRGLIGLECSPKPWIKALFEYNGLSPKLNYAFARVYAERWGYEFSAVVGRHKSPAWYTMPTIHDLRTTRFPVALAPYASSVNLDGVGLWVTRGDELAIRVSNMDSSRVAASVTMNGLSIFIQHDSNPAAVRPGIVLDVARTIAAVDTSFKPWFCHPTVGMADSVEGKAASFIQNDFDLAGVHRTLNGAQLHCLVEWNTRAAATATVAASYQYARRSFIRVGYDGWAKSAVADVTFFCSF